MPNTHSTLTSLFSDIADSIRAKTGSQATIVADDFPDAIDAIPTSGGQTVVNQDENGNLVFPASGQSVELETLSVTQNGTYTAPAGKAYDEVDVSVSGGVDYSGELLDGTISGTYSNSSITELRGFAFYKCSNLTGVNIPNVTKYGSNCFSGAGLQSIVFNTLDSSSTALAAYICQDCSSLSSVTLPNNVTTIGTYSFKGCSSLTSIQFPSTLRILNSSAFSDSGLTSIAFNEGFTTIGLNAFSGCSALISAVFPSTLTNINSNAFNGCANCILYDFRAASAIPALASKNAFTNMNANAQIVVPDALYNDWIATSNWSDSSVVGHIVAASDYQGV